MSIDIPPDVQVQITTAVALLWDKYGKPVMDKAVGHTKAEMEWRLGLRNYYDSLFERVGFVRILGRREAEPLENIFTHVNLMEKISAERWHDMSELTTNFRPRDQRRLKRMERISGETAVAEYPRLFVLGKPGAGKTTFLKHTALRAINGEIDKVPIFVTLKEVADREMELLPFIVHQFAVHQLPISEDFVARLLENGDAIVLFDGLDAVNRADDRRSQMIDRLNDFIYRYGDCPIFLTCRAAATDYTFTQFQYVEMADFDQEQIGRYIDRWFVYDEEKRRNCRRALLEDNANKAVRELAQVPLLLALLCLVFEERNEIPPMRHEIYEEATRALLSRWDANRKISRDIVYEQLSPRRKQKMLADLAFQTFEAGDYFLKERRIVRIIEEYLQGVPGLEEPDGRQVLQVMEAQHGLLVEQARGIHSFSHLTLQEYFTAYYIVNNESRGALERLATHVGDDRWDEVFVLVTSMLDNTIEFCELYLREAYQLISGEVMLLEVLRWAEHKHQHTVSAQYRAAGLRAFSFYCLFDLLNTGAPPDYIPDLDVGLVYDPDFDVGKTYDSGRAITLTIALDQTLLPIFDPACYGHVLLFTSNPNHSNVNHLKNALNYALEMANHLELTEMKVTLEQMMPPNIETNMEEWRAFAQRLGNILSRYREAWDPHQQLSIVEEDIQLWRGLSESQQETFIRYLDANILLTRCLRVAHTPDQEMLLDKFLLPPEQW